jgi:hypothetical protein
MADCVFDVVTAVSVGEVGLAAGCRTTGPSPSAIVAYGLAMLPLTVIPFAPTAFRTSAPFRRLLMKLRNHV